MREGDCLEGLREFPAASADMILADPPYHTTPLDIDAGGNDYSAIWRECARVMKPAGWMFCFGGLETFHTILDTAAWRAKFTYAWIKQQGVIAHARARHPWMQHEIIGAFVRPDLKRQTDLYMDYAALRTGGHEPQAPHKKWFPDPGSPFGTETNYVRKRRGPRPPREIPPDQRHGTSLLHYYNKVHMPKSERTPHPTQKPQALLQHVIRGYCPKGGLVIDPFAGSGSALLAARAEGRKVVGWERDCEWFALAYKRVSAALDLK